MKLKYLLAASVVSLAATTTIATPAFAQQITSGVEGQVTDANGNAIAGAVVTITNTANNSVRTTTTDGNGGFRIISLQPGNYSITVTADGFEGQTVESVNTNIGGRTAFNFALTSTSAGTSDSTIVVTGARARVSQVAVGPGTAFGAEELEAFPSITRDIRDIIRIDPRVSIDTANDVDRISCLGGNDRSNTFTVDGIVQADVFGLNGTPFAARNALPLPFDVIDQVSIEFAPFDVEYSEFTGCLVNVVTKAGGNDFHGSAFFTYFDGGLVGDLDAGSEEKRWGATLSGPIIKDRLFFSFGYEETDLADGNEFGPAGGGFLNSANFVTDDQFDEFSRIARDVYGQETGGYPTTLAESSIRYFGRLDAVIAEGHRLEATYQRLEETNVEVDTGAQNLTGLNSFEDEGTISDYYSLRLYSEWSDTISTELRLSRAEVGDVQGPVGGGEAQSDNPIVRLVVGVPPVPGETTQSGILSTGPGIFRSANQLDTKIDQARFQLNVDAGDGHLIKLGAEINDLEVFNLFVVNATGSLYFSSLANFEAGILNDGTSTNTGAASVAGGLSIGADINASQSGDVNEAAALFSRRIYSVYAQDEWQATDQLAINAGVRVQLYDGGAPTANPQFLNRYGFSNAVSFGALDPLVLPRFSATYEFDNDGFLSNSRITGGVGIFSGGDPVVYFSNAFSNNGSLTGFGALNNALCAATNAPAGPVDVVVGGTFTGLPSCVVAAASAQAAAGLADTQSTDPEFDIPSVVRANLGFQTELGTETGFFSNWRLNLDYIYSRFNDTLNFVDLSQTPNITLANGGFTVDGRPIYAAIDPTRTGCTAELQGTGGTPPRYSNVNAACFGTARDDEIQLTNGPSYESHVASIILSKRFQGGLFTQGGSFNVNFGYAFTDSQNNRNNLSAQSTSNFDGTAAFDRQNPAVSTSNFETRHNFTATFNLREEFFDGYDTNIGVFFRARSGLPYSLTFDGGAVFNDQVSGEDNALLYIPNGRNDPNVAPTSDAVSVAALIDYLNGGADSVVIGTQTINYDGSFIPGQCDFTPGTSIERNSCNQDWWFDVDLRFSQELPFLGSLTGLVDDRIELYVDFNNILNLIDENWNVLRSRPEFVDLVDAGVDAQGRYVITGFNPDDQNFINPGPSAWRIQLGARYEF